MKDGLVFVQSRRVQSRVQETFLSVRSECDRKPSFGIKFQCLFLTSDLVKISAIFSED